MADANGVFITSTSNPINVDFDAPIRKAIHLHLYAFSIKGAPTTAGVPDWTHYNIEAVDSNLTIKGVLRNDHKKSIPLPLSGGFTFVLFPDPIPMLDHPQINIEKFTLKLTNKNGDLAQYSEVCLWFQLR